ncbi:aspartate ammonia-lyase [Ramlibacter sp. XY19]|uniref:aspartate ammonia-lyase n=1 Tax=Ramlibacter paludis TaxID=2908000 RepID=UPI0023DAA962|nr:aspartate ammonia-lyase [Ramlibacter paludis]MCG2594607.1 aspartate ammonia-lyase [Ramlibacter paludis]
MRIERDFLGERHIPGDAYWGIHTARAVENFPISGTAISAMPELIRGFAFVKKAAAQANFEFGILDRERCAAICAACELLIAGRFQDQFIVDVIQGGAGTSTNMNVNEVLANLALEHLWQEKGRYDLLHPNDHVNASQSTNDTYPTAVRLGLWMGIGRLLDAMRVARQAFERKAEEFDSILKIGRTQLQDAVPMTLGQEFSAYAVMLEEDEARLREARALIQEINMGATAVGTGINAPPGYADLVCELIAKESGVPVKKARNLVEATQDTGAFVQLSGVLKRVATKLSKTCNDLRLLSSGPQAGFGDIRLPARQAGSSIMPGKVNPVIPEVVNQVAFEVIGNDLTVTMASEAGQLQLNAFEPIIGWSLFKSIDHLANACLTLASHCVDGIEANVELLARRVRESATFATALNPLIGYERAALIAKTAVANGVSIDQVALELGILTKEQLDAVLIPNRLSN